MHACRQAIDLTQTQAPLSVLGMMNVCMAKRCDTCLDDDCR